MADTHDPREIVTFIVRYLMLQMFRNVHRVQTSSGDHRIHTATSYDERTGQIPRPLERRNVTSPVTDVPAFVCRHEPPVGPRARPIVCADIGSG